MSRSRKIKKVVKSGLPQGRTGDELNCGIMPQEDARHHMKGPFKYEWWYFDAWFENGYGAAVTFCSNNYAKLWKDECWLQLHIYLPDGRTIKHYQYPPKNMFEASCYSSDLRVLDNYIRGGLERKEVHLEIEGDSVDLVFESAVSSWKPGIGVSYVPWKRYNSFGWFLPQPFSKVSGSITVNGESISVKGHGYHDRQWGDTPLFFFIDNWHWAHFILSDIGLIWWDMIMKKSLGYDHLGCLLISRGDRLIYESSDFSVTYEDWRKEGSLLHPERINVAFEGDGGKIKGEFMLRSESPVETMDLLELAGLPRFLRKAVLLSGLAKVFYARFFPDIEGFVEVEGERTPLAGRVTSEQMLMRGKYPTMCYKQQSRG